MAPKKQSCKRDRKQKPQRFEWDYSGGLAETFAETGLDLYAHDLKFEQKLKSIFDSTLEQRLKESDDKVKYFMKSWKGTPTQKPLVINSLKFGKNTEQSLPETDIADRVVTANKNPSLNFEMAEKSGSSDDYTIAFLDELVELTKLQLELGLPKTHILSREKKVAVRRIKAIGEVENLRHGSTGTEKSVVTDTKIESESSIRNTADTNTESTNCTDSKLEHVAEMQNESETGTEMEMGDIETHKNEEPIQIRDGLFKEIQEFLDNLDV